MSDLRSHGLLPKPLIKPTGTRTACLFLLFPTSLLLQTFSTSACRHVVLCSSVVYSSFATLWPPACQAPLSMGFSRQEYWSGLPFLPPGDLSKPGVEPASLVSPALAGDSLPLSYLGSGLVSCLHSILSSAH